MKCFSTNHNLKYCAADENPIMREMYIYVYTKTSHPWYLDHAWSHLQSWLYSSNSGTSLVSLKNKIIPPVIFRKYFYNPRVYYSEKSLLKIMSASPIARQVTQSQNIPLTKRVVIDDANQLPADYSSTPGGTLYSTTPGGE